MRLLGRIQTPPNLSPSRCWLEEVKNSRQHRAIYLPPASPLGWIGRLHCVIRIREIISLLSLGESNRAARRLLLLLQCVTSRVRGTVGGDGRIREMGDNCCKTGRGSDWRRKTENREGRQGR